MSRTQTMIFLGPGVGDTSHPELRQPPFRINVRVLPEEKTTPTGQSGKQILSQQRERLTCPKSHDEKELIGESLLATALSIPTFPTRTESCRETPTFYVSCSLRKILAKRLLICFSLATNRPFTAVAR